MNICMKCKNIVYGMRDIAVGRKTVEYRCSQIHGIDYVTGLKKNEGELCSLRNNDGRCVLFEEKNAKKSRS